MPTPPTQTDTPRIGSGTIVGADGRPTTGFQTLFNTTIGKLTKTVNDIAVQLGLIQTAQTTANSALAAANTAQGKAEDAAADAEAAMLQLGTFGDDDKLARVEKRQVKQRYDTLVDTHNHNLSQADIYSITTEKTAYTTAYNAWMAYLATLTTPVLWSDYSDYTTIVDSVWQAKWGDVYETRSALLKAIADAAKAYANKSFGDGSNRVRFSRMESGTLGWAKLFDGAGIGGAFGVPVAGGYRIIQQVFTATGSGQTISVGNNMTDAAFRIPVTPGERIHVQMRVQADFTTTGGGTWTAVLGWMDENGSPTASGRPTIGTGSSSPFGQLISLFYTVPAGARSAWIELYAVPNGAGPGSIGIIEPMLCGAGLEQTTVPAFNPGPSNEYGADVTSYIVGPVESVFEYEYTGAERTGQFPRTLLWSLQRQGAAVTSGVTARGMVKSGSINGVTAASGWFPMTVTDTGLASQVVSNLQAASSVLVVEMTYGGVARTFEAKITKHINDAPVTSTGGGGGGGGGPVTIASGGIGSGISSSTSSFTSIATFTGTIPTGASSAVVSFSTAWTPDYAKAGSCNIQMVIRRTIAGTPTDISSIATGTAKRDGAWEIENEPEIGLSVTDTGLSAGTTYTWGVYARCSSGSIGASCTGSYSVTS